VFDQAVVLKAFEEATGVRLVEHPKDPDLDQTLAKYPTLTPFLTGVSYHESAELDEDRLGGTFGVRIYLEGEPDRGVRDYGLECAPEERGKGYNVLGTADRANVEVEFFKHLNEAAEITPQAQETWSLLISCLRGL